MPEPRVFRQSRFQPPPGAAELVLVRHGESEPLVEGSAFPLVGGHGDPALAPEGRVQAERVGEALAREPIAAIYVTTLRRTAETAAPLAARLGLVPRVEADLREVHLGDWEGELFRQKVADQDPVAVAMVAEQRWDVIPGAEPAERFAARIERGIGRIAAAHPDQRVVVVAHGGSIGEALAQATGSRPWAFVGADNGSISRLVVLGDRWTLRGFNDIGHLTTT
jgi:2,3-bisphosphoglycerate-dependent phosphoglycerate mutase